MGGFRKAMPFTYGCFIIGGLALSGIPPFSGFFSKDDILLVTGERGGWHWALYVAGYVGAFLTAIYTFRMIFRAFHGEPVAEARELEAGHLHHAETPTNPANGEVEDTDVGFPGPTTRSPSGRCRCRWRWACWRSARSAPGSCRSRRSTSWSTTSCGRRSPARRSTNRTPKTGCWCSGWCSAPRSALAGIALAYRIWVGAPGTVDRARERFRPLYELFVNKWYFDEMIDAPIVRPAAAVGRFARDTFERVFVDETLVGGATGVVRAGSAAVRARAERLHALLRRAAGARRRGRRLLLPAADLIATMPPLSILLWLPAACGLLGAASRCSRRARPRPRPRPAARRAARAAPGASPALALIGTLAALGARDRLHRRLQAARRPAARHRRRLDLRAGHPLQARDRRAERVPARADDAAVRRRDARREPARQWERPRLFYFHFMLAESAVLGAFLAQDLALFVAFFDLMLIPFYFLIGGWGREPGRVKATIKLVIYTLVGSLLMLAAAIATGVLAAAAQRRAHHVRALRAAARCRSARGSQEWIFLFFAAAFLVKMPAFPFHGWMPDGYAAMPIEVLMVFSGVLSKVGAYGFLAIVLPLFPQAAVHFQTLMLLIALLSIIYGSAAGLHPDRRAPDRRLLLGRPARLHHARDLLSKSAGRPGSAAADGQPRAGGRAAAVHHRAALPARGRLGGHPRDGRHRLPRAGARRRCS